VDDSAHSLHVIVLAAGSSSRLGQPKQLAKLGGRPALHIVVSNAVAVAGHAVTVVIGAHSQELTRLLAHSPATVVVNRHWEEGIASSLRHALTAVPPTASAVLVMLGDQVAVTSDDLKRLINAWNGHDTVIASAVYQGHVGVPAIFPRWCFSELRELRGDRGARMIIERHAQRLVHVQMPNAAIDLDTPEDLEKLTEQFKKKPGEAVH